MKTLNIHGYHGTPQNAAYSALCKISDDIVSPSIDYDREQPDELLDRLLDLCADENAEMIVGTSLGGFFASVIAAKRKLPLLLVNPCLRPQAVIPALGYDRDVSFFVKMSDTLGELDLDRVRCVIGGKDEIIGDHSVTRRILGQQRIVVVDDGMHSGATLDLDKHFPKFVREVFNIESKVC